LSAKCDTVQMDGYVRGLEFVEDHILVGRSKARRRSCSTGKQETPTDPIVPTALLVLDDRLTGIREVRLDLFGNEIYDLLILPDQSFDAISKSSEVIGLDVLTERIEDSQKVVVQRN